VFTFHTYPSQWCYPDGSSQEVALQIEQARSQYNIAYIDTELGVEYNAWSWDEAKLRTFETSILQELYALRVPWNVWSSAAATEG